MNNQGGNSANQPLNKSSSGLGHQNQIQGNNKIIKQSKRTRQQSQKNDSNHPRVTEIYSTRMSDDPSVHYLKFSLGSGGRRYSYDES